MAGLEESLEESRPAASVTIFASIFGFLRLHNGPRFLDQYIFRALVSQHPTTVIWELSTLVLLFLELGFLILKIDSRDLVSAFQPVVLES